MVSGERFDGGMAVDGELTSTPYIKLVQKYPPMYVVVHNGVEITPRPLDDNVFDTIAIFLYLIDRDLGGYLGNCPNVHDRHKQLKSLRNVLKDDLLCENSAVYRW